MLWAVSRHATAPRAASLPRRPAGGRRRDRAEPGERSTDDAGDAPLPLALQGGLAGRAGRRHGPGAVPEPAPDRGSRGHAQARALCDLVADPTTGVTRVTVVGAPAPPVAAAGGRAGVACSPAGPRVESAGSPPAPPRAGEPEWDRPAERAPARRPAGRRSTASTPARRRPTAAPAAPRRRRRPRGTGRGRRATGAPPPAGAHPGGDGGGAHRPARGARRRPRGAHRPPPPPRPAPHRPRLRPGGAGAGGHGGPWPAPGGGSSAP